MVGIDDTREHLLGRSCGKSGKVEAGFHRRRRYRRVGKEKSWASVRREWKNPGRKIDREAHTFASVYPRNKSAGLRGKKKKSAV